jgi:hypothetical protein
VPAIRPATEASETSNVEDIILMRQPRDLSRVSLAEDLEARWWAHRFGITRMELEVAVEEAGDHPEKVADYVRTL